MGLLKTWKNWRINRQRLLFPYWDGSRKRLGDPLRIWRTITTDSTIDLEAMAPLVDLNREPATSLMLAAICRAFGVEKFDQDTNTGLTDWEILRLLWSLESYMLALKKNINPGQNLPPSTDSASSTVPDAPSEDTNSSSACG
jgi:hypothetical protein